MERADDPAGTATHVAAFLLVEHHGPWGTAVLRDSRLDEDVRRHLSGIGAVRVLLARRHHRAHRGPTYAVHVCFPHTQRLLRHEVTDHRELLDLDTAALARGEEPPGWVPVTEPLYGVCTHGRHDACCAERGRPVAAALTAIRPEQTWEVSHVGGDRFAANVLVLPQGLYYGQVTAADAAGLADRHESGRLDLDRLRGRSSRPMHVQHAEVALRRHLGDDRESAVRVVRRDGELTEFAHGEDTWVVRVRRGEGEVEGRLTCGAARPGRVPVFEVLSLERV
ncbi:sucrase ferredoxin [Marmoricola sp. Leaf446]|uniref:sucrase ferredoxin n=1 Tax=Marmoricola sp. Leaf446 TaxID=1736379 RepID=UPI0021007F97|nr:sucrase ferredoxin [Marmoricola sp. Leaf446]